MYLGENLEKKTFKDDTSVWGLSLAKYVQQAVWNVKTYLPYESVWEIYPAKAGQEPVPM
jgi:hypothetical protein